MAHQEAKRIDKCWLYLWGVVAVIKLAFLNCKALTFTNIYEANKRRSQIVAAQNRAVKLIAAASDRANTVI